MPSRYVNELRETANGMDELGFPLSASVCRESANRMQRMEDYIVQVNEAFKEFQDDPNPR